MTDAIFEWADTSSIDTIKKMNLKQPAEIVGIEYHNFKNMYSGRGNANNLLQYRAFLYENWVNFVSLQYTEYTYQLSLFLLRTLTGRKIYGSRIKEPVFFCLCKNKRLSV